MEGEFIIGVQLDGQSVTLEPGGQFELSGAPVETIHQTCAEVNSHLYQVGFGFRVGEGEWVRRSKAVTAWCCHAVRCERDSWCCQVVGAARFLVLPCSAL